MFVVTPTVRENLDAAEMILASNRCLLLQGVIGCGKSSLALHLARLHGAFEELIEVSIDETFDSKDLLGKYEATSTPGAFEWVAGPLTAAARDGRWLLLEDIDLASFDIFSAILPLLETGSIYIAEKDLWVPAHPSFRLIATQQLIAAVDGRTQLKKHAVPHHESWGCLHCDSPPPSEIIDIVTRRFPVPVTLVQAVTGVISSVREHVTSLSLREVIQWAKRISGTGVLAEQSSGFYSSGQRETFLREAIDCFCARIPLHASREHLLKAFAVALEVPEGVARAMLTEHKPQLSVGDTSIRVGRITLPISGAGGPRLRESRVAFAQTKLAMTLLERLAGAAHHQEPVLLTGETGVGKTFMVQTLADIVGQELLVHNMNQQTDSSDFMGGWKPQELTGIMKRLTDDFLDLFAASFNAASNQEFVAFVLRLQQSHNHRQLYMAFQKGIQSFTAKCAASRVQDSANDALAARWALFKDRVDEIEHFVAAGGEGAVAAPMMFKFEEGTLVRAWKDGHWLLLDEVNLASPEVLERISSILSETDTLFLTERGGTVAVKRHPNFRLFANMNPPTDVGKKELPPSLRSKFIEFYVEEPRCPFDLAIIVREYIAHLQPQIPVDEIVHLFLACVDGVRSRLSDSSGETQPPHFSLRTLTRALDYVRKATPTYGFKVALYDGLMMSFATPLGRRFHHVVESMIMSDVFKSREPLRPTPPKKPMDGKEYVAYEHLWLEVGDQAVRPNENYILTPSTMSHLKNIARAVTSRRPVLLEGPTSAGKSSMVEFLAGQTAHGFVRINNHESTEVQEYLGHYVSDESGRLRYVDGVLVTAVRKGWWVVLDELNLAPTEVLEALNRLLDDNCELFIPETQETIKPHPHLRIFATQNPAGIYGGRKVLSRAFRNRFLEIIVDDIPTDELSEIITKRFALPPSFATKMVEVMVRLQEGRKSSSLFAGRHGFVTPRDLFRWANRKPLTYDELAMHGALLLGERCRKAAEKQFVWDTISSIMRVEVTATVLYDPMRWPQLRPFAQRVFGDEHSQRAIPELQRFCWTDSMKRLFTLTGICMLNQEPVLLVGETGCSKTTICQIWALILGHQMDIVNCHQHTEAADFLGALRPAHRNGSYADGDQEGATAQGALFDWYDGPLVRSMKTGGIFVLDEISLAEDSVLERLNSVLEPSRTVTLAEKSTADVVVAHEAFRILATMNPGGDFGKKELSPALRNRFTEIYVSPIDSMEEVALVASHRLHPSLQSFAQPMAEVLLGIARISSSHCVHVSLRDIDSWTRFLNTTLGNCDPNFAFFHGADAVLLDGVAVGAGTVSTVAATQQRMDVIRAAATTLAFDLSRLGAPFWEQCHNPLFDVSALNPARYSFQAATTRQNLSKLMRAMTMNISVLLEGSPGVGKTSIVEALGRALGVEVVRINLSDQTDIMDLLGAFLPGKSDQGAPQFSWVDGILLKAVKSGAWVILDELNLANQTVLEGLNSLLDHRHALFVPELSTEFKAHEALRIFGCQNPVLEGGGRKGLPKSFLNRFAKVHIEPYSSADLLLICASLFPNVEASTLELMVGHVNDLHHQVVAEKRFGTKGGPWEFNLRDTLRWASMMEHYENPNPRAFGNTLFTSRFRTEADRSAVSALLAQRFPAGACEAAAPLLTITDTAVMTNGSVLCTTVAPPTPAAEGRSPFLLLASQQPILCSLLKCIELRQLVTLVGPIASGKSSIIQLAAQLVGARVHTVSISAGCDTVDLLGGFDQVEGQQGVFQWSDSPLVRAMEEGSWVVLDNANFCSSSVLDRLNPVVEPHGYLTLNEQGLVDGKLRVIHPHPNFRMLLTMDPKYGEVSRAMRNRAVELFVPSLQIPSHDAVAIAALRLPTTTVETIASFCFTHTALQHSLDGGGDASIMTLLQTLTSHCHGAEAVHALFNFYVRNNIFARQRALGTTEDVRRLISSTLDASLASLSGEFAYTRDDILLSTHVDSPDSIVQRQVFRRALLLIARARAAPTHAGSLERFLREALLYTVAAVVKELRGDPVVARSLCDAVGHSIAISTATPLVSDVLSATVIDRSTLGKCTSLFNAEVHLGESSVWAFSDMDPVAVATSSRLSAALAAISCAVKTVLCAVCDSQVASDESHDAPLFLLLEAAGALLHRFIVHRERVTNANWLEVLTKILLLRSLSHRHRDIPHAEALAEVCATAARVLAETMVGSNLFTQPLPLLWKRGGHPPAASTNEGQALTASWQLHDDRHISLHGRERLMFNVQAAMLLQEELRVMAALVSQRLDTRAGVAGRAGDLAGLIRRFVAQAAATVGANELDTCLHNVLHEALAAGHGTAAPLSATYLSSTHHSIATQLLARCQPETFQAALVGLGWVRPATDLLRHVRRASLADAAETRFNAFVADAAKFFEMEDSKPSAPDLLSTMWDIAWSELLHVLAVLLPAAQRADVEHLIHEEPRDAASQLLEKLPGIMNALRSLDNEQLTSSLGLLERLVRAFGRARVECDEERYAPIGEALMLTGALLARLLAPRTAVDPSLKWGIKLALAHASGEKWTSLLNAFRAGYKMSHSDGGAAECALLSELACFFSVRQANAVKKFAPRPDSSGKSFVEMGKLMGDACATFLSPERIPITSTTQDETAATKRARSESDWSTPPKFAEVHLEQLEVHVNLIQATARELLRRFVGFEDFTFPFMSAIVVSWIGAEVLRAGCVSRGQAPVIPDAEALIAFPRRLSLRPIAQVPAGDPHHLRLLFGFLQSSFRSLSIGESCEAVVMLHRAVPHTVSGLFHRWRELFAAVQRLEDEEIRAEQDQTLYKEKAVIIEGDDEKFMRVFKEQYPEYDRFFEIASDEQEEVAADVEHDANTPASAAAVTHSARSLRQMFVEEGCAALRIAVDAHRLSVEAPLRRIARRSPGMAQLKAGERAAALAVHGQLFDQLLPSVIPSFTKYGHDGGMLAAFGHRLAETSLLLQRRVTMDSPPDVSEGLNVYRDVCVPEGLLAGHVVGTTLRRVAELRGTFPENSVLERIEKIGSRLVHLPVLQTPLMKLMCGTEILLRELHEWERNATATVSLLAHIGTLSRLVIRWRRFELSCWARILTQRRTEYENRCMTVWFEMHELCCGSDGTSPGMPDSQLLEYVTKFVSAASLGDFEVRLGLLRSFGLQRCHTPLGNILLNAAQLYGVFSTTVAETLREDMDPIHQQLQDYCSAMRWEDGNYYAVRSATQKSHLAISRMIARCDEVLRKPVLPLLTARQTHEDELADMGLTPPAPQAPVKKGSAKRPKRKRDGSGKEVSAGTPTEAVVPAIAAGTSELQAFAEEVLERVKQLQVTTAKSAVKQRALKILFETLEERAYPTVTDDVPVSIDDAFAAESGAAAALACSHASPLPDSATTSKYFKLLHHLQRLRGLQRNHHKDLTTAQVRRGLAVCEGLFRAAFLGRQALIETLPSLSFATSAACEVEGCGAGQAVVFVPSEQRDSILSVFADVLAVANDLAQSVQDLQVNVSALVQENRVLANLSDKVAPLCGSALVLHENLLVCRFTRSHEIGAVTEHLRTAARAIHETLPHLVRASARGALTNLTRRLDAVAASLAGAAEAVKAAPVTAVGPPVASRTFGSDAATDDAAMPSVPMSLEATAQWAAELRGSLLALTHARTHFTTLAPGYKDHAATLRCVAAELAAHHDAVCEAGLVLARLFAILALKGFCKPEDQDEDDEDGQGEDEGLKEGTGMDDGQGEKDVTDQLENEDQLMNAKDKEQQEERNDDDDDGRDEEEEDKAADVETDFVADKREREESDDDDDDGDSDDSDAEDKEHGDVEDEGLDRKKRKAEKNSKDDEMREDEGGDAEEVPEDEAGGEDEQDPDGRDDEETGGFQDKEKEIRDAAKERGEKDMELMANDDGHDANEEDDGDDEASQDEDGVDRSVSGSDAEEKEATDSEVDPDMAPNEDDANHEGEGNEDEDHDEAHGERRHEDASISGEDEADTPRADAFDRPKDENHFDGGQQDDEAGSEDAEGDRDKDVEAGDDAGADDEQGNENDADDAGRNWKRRQNKQQKSTRKDEGESTNQEQSNPFKAIEEALRQHSERKNLNLKNRVKLTAAEKKQMQQEKHGEKEDSAELSETEQFEFDEEATQEGLAPREDAPREADVAKADDLEKRRAEMEDEAGSDGGGGPGSDSSEDEGDEDEGPSAKRRSKPEKIDNSDEDERRTKDDEEAADSKRSKRKGAQSKRKEDEQSSEGSDRAGSDDEDGKTDAAAAAAWSWQEHEAAVEPLAHQLCEQLRIILEPTVADKLQGDYKTGKRINIKKIIPYIASQYKKDKIWLRRTKPNKRAYQLLIALDDSLSMQQNSAGAVSCQAVALIANALRRLDVGEFGIVAFGKEPNIVHPLAEPFLMDSGPRAFARLTFEQKSTSMRSLLESTLEYLDHERVRIASQVRSTTQQLMQIMFIVTDGQLTEDRAALRALVARAEANNQVLVLIILDVKAAAAATSTGLSAAPGASGDIETLRPGESKAARLRRLNAERSARMKRVQSSSVLDMQVVEFDGKKVLKRRYLENFPFPFYLVVSDLQQLPEMLADAMRQWFEMMSRT